MKDALGDRMKKYESTCTVASALPNMPIIARLDGKSFHTFCKGLERPYDERLSALMKIVVYDLMEESGADLGYTQSDEITLVFRNDKPNAQAWFGGKFYKLMSVLAAKASVSFNNNLGDFIPEKACHSPVFDCRVFQVPTLGEAANCIYWRELDATRNSISMAAQAQFSHKYLQGVSSKDMLSMLEEVGVIWGNYPTFFKRGSYVSRQKVYEKFSSVENLPEKHAARVNPELQVERTILAALEIGPLSHYSVKSHALFPEYVGGTTSVTQ